MSRQAGVHGQTVNLGGVRNRGRRRMLLAITVAAAAFIATGAVPAGAAVPFKAVVTLTPATATLGGKITAAVNKSTKPAGDALRKIRLYWGDGTKAITLASLGSRPTHRYSRPGAFTVRLTLVDQHGNLAHGSAVEHVLVAAGSYSGLSPESGLHFYVGFGHANVQDVSASLWEYCSDGSGFYDTLIVPTVTLASAGSFSGSRTDTGVLKGQAVNYAHHVTGRFTWSSTAGLRAQGTMRETITFPDSGVSCTTNTITWHAARDTQPTQTNNAPPTGSYAGLGGSGLRFFVSLSHTSVQDVSASLWEYCSDGSGFYDTLIMPAANITGAGSFSNSRTDTGVLKGQAMSYAYSFRGNFHGIGSNSAERVAGTMRETITFPDSGVICTTDTVAWAGNRETQPAQTNAAPPTGSYSGLGGAGGLRLFVSASHTSVQDVSASLWEYCSDGSGFYDTLILPAAVIASTGSFSATGTDTGIRSGKAANYSYVFRGNFHGIGPDAAARVAGTMRETITFPDSGVTCTTDTLAWAGERDTQPTQQSTPPPAGTYTGLSPFSGLSFSVVSGTNVETVSASLWENCSDGTGFYDTLIVPSAAINADGSFSATTHDTGIHNGHPTDYTYTFRGNFHSIGPDATERAAGTMRETITFTDNNLSCTTNTLAWAAHRTS